MPSGGRLTIELATVVSDGPFIAQHPNVRPGAHALITVTEAKRAAQSQWPAGLEDTRPWANIPRPLDRPGVDLGALQGLIRDCGGHLWMTAEPGTMELKIRLPQPILNTTTDPRGQAAKAGRGRSITKWLRN
jgi:hypothetical protein